jgi:hypothetical protein
MGKISRVSSVEYIATFEETEENLKAVLESRFEDIVLSSEWEPGEILIDEDDSDMVILDNDQVYFNEKKD